MSRLPLIGAVTLLACSAFGQTLTTLHDFGSVPHDGQAPGSGVIMDGNGNLFGTTGTGGSQVSDGTVFELSPPAVAGNPWTETILHRFRGVPDGNDPISRLIMKSDGSLFGTTSRGGANNTGTAYSVTPGRGEKVIHDFGTVPDDAVQPTLGFFAAAEGLYGVDSGGANSTGAFYLLTKNVGGGAWTQHILYNFGPFQSGDGVDPSGELVRDSSGNFYGVTAQGGSNNLGAVYEISPPAASGTAWTEKVLFSFNGTDGTLPAGRLLLGRGKLFGTTNGGGSDGAGTVFELNQPSAPGGPWTEKILYAFTGGSDGTSPGNGVISDAAGNLYGTAGSTVFELTPPAVASGSWKETVLHTFSGPDGFAAVTPLTLVNNALYGTTQLGGAFGTGTVFQLTLP